MQDKKIKELYLFCYGSLMKGLHNHIFLKNATYINEHAIKGTLYSLGLFPALKKGKNKVIGEIYKIDAHTLNRIDQLEGYREKEKESSFYNRKSFKAVIDGKKVKVFYYEFSGDITRYKPLESGVKWNNQI